MIAQTGHNSRKLFLCHWLISMALLIIVLVLLVSCTDRLETGSQVTPAPFAAEITFSSDRKGDDDIYVLKTKTGELVRLTDDPGEDIWPVWSPDGGYIAFLSDRNGHWDLYVIDADGHNAQNLSHNSSNAMPTFSWSPDSKRLAFESFESADRRIRVIDVDGGEAVPLTDSVTTEGEPIWSPNGRRIAYKSSKPEGYGLAIVELETGQTTQVLENERWIMNPVWSPDSNWIAFETARQDGTARVDVVKADGSQRFESICGDLLAVAPAWAYNGDWIAFVGGLADSGSSQLFLARIDGSELTTLVGDGVIDPLVWSPDDEWIIFTGISSKLGRRPGDLDIYAVEVNGPGFINLTPSQGNDEAPDWHEGQ